MNPIDRANEGDIDFFRSVALDVLLNSTDEVGRSVLACAVSKNQLTCCQEICRRCPSLLYHQNRNKNTALHHAAWTGKPRMAKFLLTAGVNPILEDQEVDIESRGEEMLIDKKLLTMVNRSKCTALHLAVENQHSETVKLLIQADPDKELLRMVHDRKDTALHMAVVNQNIEIIKLLIEADPDKKTLQMVNDNMETALHLAVKNHSLEQVKLLTQADPEYKCLPNKDGKTPLYLATEYGSYEIVEHILETCQNSSHSGPDGMTALRVAVSQGKSDIRKLLLEKQPSQSKVRTAQNGWTSLHYAASLGNLNAVQEIIQFCPDCMELVDNEDQNFLHVAAEYEEFEIVRHVLGIKEIADSILNGKDKRGNTPLHIAALTGKQNIILCLLYDPRVNKMTMNTDGQKVLDAINFEYDKEKAGIYGVRDRVNEKQLKDQSDFDLVVNALIATVSFTAGITVPGGYLSEGPNKGMAVLSKRASFEAFVISNTFALLFSLTAVFSHFCTRHLLKKKDIIFQINLATYCTLGAIFAMMVAFISGSYSVLSISDRLATSVCVISSSFFVYAFHALWRMAMQYKPADY